MILYNMKQLVHHYFIIVYLGFILNKLVTAKEKKFCSRNK